MKAAILENVGAPLRISNATLPELGGKEVLVKLAYAAINHRDIYISKGLYAGIQTPCILGSDGAGIIEEVGGALNEDWIGKEVIINPNINWGENENFKANTYQILGMPTNGTFAEYVKVNIDRVHLKPEHLSLKAASALPLAGLTAYRALFTKGNLIANQKVLINGVGGGVAQFAFQFALAAEVEVYVTSGNAEKLKKAIEMGAKDGISYKTESWAKDLAKSSGGIDLAIDSAGGKGFADLLKVMNPGGTIVTYGGTRGKVDGLSPQILFWKQLNILGSTMGSDTDFKQMLAFVNEKQIEPTVSKVFPLNEVNEAFDYIEQEVQFGKVLLEIN